MSRATNLRALLRYNSGIVWGHTPWLMVVPVAASMLVLFWNMAIASMFTPSKAAQTTEGLASILTALLCAHLFGVEYRHRVGEITFSKPFAARRIVYLRLIAVFLLVAVLQAVMLFVYVVGIGEPFPVGGVILAGLPSVLFLSMLSLMVATLFRQPVLGLAAAGLYWVVDAYGGVDLHPLLSLQGYAGALRQDTMAALWLPGKILITALGIALYLVNLRLIGRPEGIRTRAKTARNAAILVAVAVLYLYSGAAIKVAYGLRHDGEHPNLARDWYRERFAIYGSLPVPRLMGRDFADYVGAVGRAQEADSKPDAGTRFRQREIDRMRGMVSRSPRSRWADHAIYALARILQASDVEADRAEAKGLLMRLAQEYPESAFAPAGLWNLQKLARGMGDAATADAAYAQLVERYPASPEAATAADTLSRILWEQGAEERALALVRDLAPKAEPKARASLWQRSGDLLVEMERQSEARDCYTHALDELEPVFASVEEAVNKREDVPNDLMMQRGKLQFQREKIRAALQELGE